MPTPLTLAVYLKPKAKRTGWAGLHDNQLKLRVTEPAIDGRANDALRAFLASEFGVSERAVTILTGERSRMTRVEISDVRRCPPGVPDPGPLEID